MSKRYFINNLDTRIGKALIDQLVKEPAEDPVHMCTMRNENVIKPNGIKKILKRAKPKLSKKKMLEECDVYVYSLENTDFSDIKFALDSLDKGVEEQKVLMLVSDVRVWSDSGKKKVLKVQKGENQEQGEEGEGQGEGEGEGVEKKSQDPNENSKEQGQKDPSNKGSQKSEKQEGEGEDDDQEKEGEPEEDPYMYVPFEEQDYLQRKPLSQYQYIKEAEDYFLNFKRENVKVIIVCPGILYGQGEEIFEDLFRAAWLQNPKALPYLGEGDNLLPTIHIADLAKFIVKLAESPPEEKVYFNAFDLTQDRSQKSIIESISKGAGSGLVESVESSEIIRDPQTFKLDIQVLPSKELRGTEEEPVDFEWTAKNGLHETIKSVLKEFCIHHSLRPIKILAYVNEEDARESNYSRIIKDLESQYRIPVLRSKEILEYAFQHLEGEFKLDLQDEYSAILDYLDTNKPRPLDETLKVYYRVLKWRLSRNDCATRGYILDGEPHFEDEFKHVFLPQKPSKLKRKVKRPKPPVVIPTKKTIQEEENKEEDESKEVNEEDLEKNEPEQPAAEEGEKEEPEQEEAEENDDGDEERPLKEEFYPESVIVIKNLSLQKEEKFQVVEYLSLHGTQELLYNSIGKSQLIVSESLRSYIERNGRPNNYLISKEILKAEHQKYYSELNNALLKQKVEDEQKSQSVIESNKQHREDIAAEVYRMIQDEGEFQIKKMPFRNYLMEFVVPTLNQSLLEVSNIIPNDPVELLAEYLYQRSYES